MRALTMFDAGKSSLHHGAAPSGKPGHWPGLEVLGQYVEGLLNSDVRASVEAHLAECLECRTTVASAAERH
jgi:anti-sigma factor RsiW